MCLTQSSCGCEDHQVGPQASHWCGPYRAALVNARLQAVVGDQALYIGTDDRGIVLEMVIVPDDRRQGSFAMIHCMPIELP